ncbi:hypothetical protein [Paenibacillus donghaensis]|uniref:Uncharacterized protein n=1 Tax=Paenibacillus donghaensis TaxID=414771 RepID=A0A2Z2KJB9_9BACL|nr:hypothetical protein [Paenibacillus donghaensis]ASA23380.1 hypothetical protein B9T62_22775 [Paenibacillus donghaensis]
MVNDVGIHCSEKYVYYINRKKNPEEFRRVEETMGVMNAIFSEMSEDFLIEDHKMMKVVRKRINQARDEIENIDEPNSEVKKGKGLTQGAFICNFFVVPINRLRVYDLQKQKTTEVGLNVKVYTRINKKEYKCIQLDLLNETLANSKWIDPNYLDYDFFLYRENIYPYLLRAIRLATRLLDDDDAKVIFNDEIGWVDNFYGRDNSGYLRYIKDSRGYKWMESEDMSIEIDPMKFNAVIFLNAVQGLIHKSEFLEMDNSSKLQEDFIGWENENIWAIKYSLIKPHVTNELKRTGRNFKIDNKLYAFLFKQGILSIEGDVEGVFRPDAKIGSANKRALVLDKMRFHEFIEENQHIIE